MTYAKRAGMPLEAFILRIQYCSPRFPAMINFAH